jgi:DNA-binding beta-propeller fold protein YncE
MASHRAVHHESRRTWTQNDNVYVVEIGNHRVQKFTSDGVFLTKWGQVGNNPDDFSMPRDVAVDSQGYAFVVDLQANRVLKFGPSTVPVASTTWGRIKAQY